MSEKRYLLTPGPTPVPPEVLAAISQPIIHHRGPDFKPIYERSLTRLREVFRTDQDVLVFGAAGTGAMESAVANLCSPGERVLVVSAGHFGERWRSIASAYGAEVEALEYEWGEIPSAEDVAARLQELGGAKAVFITHSETSTGVVCDLQSLAAAVSEQGALSVVDAVSSLGAVPLEMDEWGLDVVISGSQKALMAPPGLATAAVSPAAWEQVERSTLPSFYFDWQRTRKAQEQLDSAFTPAVSLIVALDVALGLLLEDGLENAFERHVRLGRACRAGIKAMGLELYSPDDDSAAVLTGALTPEGIDAVALRLALRDRHGITIAGGHGELVSRLFRIGHIGHVGIEELAGALVAIEEELAVAGADVEPGRAAPAAYEAFGTVATA